MQDNMLNLPMIMQAVRENILKIVILVACSCCMFIILGIVKYSSDQKNIISEEEEKVEVEEEAYALSKDEYDEYSSEIVFDMYAHKEYYNNSILMHVDPLHIPVENASFVVKVENLDTIEEINYAIGNIKKVYHDLVYSDEMYQAVKGELESISDKKYLNELIYFDQDVSKVNFSAEGAYSSSGYAYMKMQAIGKDSEMAKRIMDILILYLEQKDISDVLDINYNLELVGRESTYFFNSSLEAKQRNQLALCAYFYGNGTYDSMQNTLRLVTDAGSNSTQVETEQEPIIYFLVMYIALGIILGILLSGTYIVLRCLKDQRIYDYIVYGHQEKIPVLQLSQYENNINNPLLIFDLKSLLSKANNKKLLIVSQEKINLPESWNTVLDELRIEIQIENEFLTDVSKLDKLRNAENILIICRNRKTTYKELDSIVERAKMSEIGIQGIVVV